MAQLVKNLAAMLETWVQQSNRFTMTHCMPSGHEVQGAGHEGDAEGSLLSSMF